MSGTPMNEDAAARGQPRGVTPPSGRGGRFLSDVIVELGLAEREAVEQALEASRAPGEKLGSTLVEMGLLSEQDLARAVAERYRLDYLDLDEFDVDPEAARVIGHKEMKRYEAAPVAFTEDGALVVAMLDPADWLAAEEIAQLTGRRIRRAVASGAGIAQVIARVAEGDAGARDEPGDVLEDNGPAPARLTLRRVTNPLGRPAPSVAPSGVSGMSSPPTPAGGRPPELQAPAPGIRGVQPEPQATADPPLDGPQDGERARIGTELRAIGAELTETRSELTTVRAWADAALKRAVEGERELGDARVEVSRLTAELTAARDQAETLRADLSWTRRQIEQKDEREAQLLADLRNRIEATDGPPANRPQPPSPALQPPSKLASSGGSGSRPHPATPPHVGGHPPLSATSEEDGGASGAHDPKRLIAAARRL